MLNSRNLRFLLKISSRTSSIFCRNKFKRIMNLASIRDNDKFNLQTNKLKYKNKLLDKKNIHVSCAVQALSNEISSDIGDKKSVFEDLHNSSKKMRKPLDPLEIRELVEKLSESERTLVITTINELNSKMQLRIYEDQLAKHRWRSKFGRPSQIAPKLGDVDPTGTYCPVPEDWLQRSRQDLNAKAMKPKPRDLLHLMVANSIPFIGFGFLDNFIMIVAGDSIDHVLGSYICISTMAAAALGNTFSDVVGIGSAFYVEKMAERIGFQPPKLTPSQLEMPISRRASNMGRVLGITIGCLLGMLPLLFIKEDTKAQKSEKKD